MPLNLSPRSLSEIKRLARHFYKREGLRYAAALNKAARFAGHASYQAALRAGGDA